MMMKECHWVELANIAMFLSSNVKLTSEKMTLKTGQYFQLDGLESLNRAASEWRSDEMWLEFSAKLYSVHFLKISSRTGFLHHFCHQNTAFLTAFILCVYLAMFWMHSEMDKNCVLHAKNFSKIGLADMISELQLRYYSENPQLCASGFYLPSSSHQTSPLPCEGCNWAFGISSLPSQPLYFLTCLYTSVSSFFIVASGILLFFSFSLAYIAKNL